MEPGEAAGWQGEILMDRDPPPRDAWPHPTPRRPREPRTPHAPSGSTAACTEVSGLGERMEGKAGWPA